MLVVSEICQRINSLRLKKNWKQEELAAYLHISQSAVSTYLRDRIPPAEVLLRLAKLGNTTIEWILTGEKSYLYTSETKKLISSHIQEQNISYDTDWMMAKRVAGLNAEVRQALFKLIEELSKKENRPTSYDSE